MLLLPRPLTSVAVRSTHRGLFVFPFRATYRLSSPNDTTFGAGTRCRPDSTIETRFGFDDAEQLAFFGCSTFLVRPG